MAVDATNAANDLAPEAPVSDAPLTFAEGDEAIAALLGDPEEDPAEGTESNESAEDAPEPSDEPAGDEDEIDPEALSEDDEPVATEEPDASEDYAGGRFAADDAKVKLDDGTTISIAELKRNNLFQRDYSKKTEEVAREREALTAKETELSQVSDALSKEREYVLWYIENNIPQEPQRPTASAENDPYAWVKYQEQLANYQQHVQAWQMLHQGKQAEEQKKQTETKAEYEKRIAGERQTFLSRYPNLRDDNARAAWFEDTFKGASEAYGVSMEELNGITSAKQLEILRDAVLYRRAKAKTQTVRKDVQTKPATVTGSGRRQNPDAVVARQGQQVIKRLRETGNVRDADEAILRHLG